MYPVKSRIQCDILCVLRLLEEAKFESNYGTVGRCTWYPGRTNILKEVVGSTSGYWATTRSDLRVPSLHRNLQSFRFGDLPLTTESETTNRSPSSDKGVRKEGSYSYFTRFYLDTSIIVFSIKRWGVELHPDYNHLRKNYNCRRWVQGVSGLTLCGHHKDIPT